MAASALLHHLLKPPSPLLKQPLTSPRLPRSLLTLFPSPSSSSSSSSSSLRLLCSISSLTHIVHEESDFVSEQEEYEETEPLKQPAIGDTEPLNILTAVSSRTLATEYSTKPPSLTVKEKKELTAYAHSLGKKLKSQQVGKSGVTSSLAASFIETLEANELLKLKVHNSCPGELTDVVTQLEEATGSVAIGQIGRSLILYRPSLSKMKAAAERKKQVERLGRKRFTLKSKEQDAKGEGRVLRLSGRGRRGSSRF